jgi:Rieske 2Fe-2S family protein
MTSATPPPRSAVERSLPRDAYIAESHYERERERIFHREWFCVGRAEALPNPGDYLLCDVAGESVIVLRARDGELRAHYNLCRHRGSRLSLADPRPATCSAVTPTDTFRGVIMCPYHAWSYEFDGSVRNAPFLEEADDFRKQDFGLFPVGVASWGGFIFLNLTPDVARERAYTVAEQLGPIARRVERYPLADLRTARRIVYHVAANWKVIAENYNECYHCAGVHPELCRIVPAFKQNGGAGLDWEHGIPQAEGTFTFTFTGHSDRAPFPGLAPEEQVRHKGELIYPNLMLSLSADHAAAFVLLPDGPERTTVVCDFLFHPSEIARPSFDPSDAVEFWALVNRQDWRICEAVQQGMRSRMFTSGYYAPMEDASLDIRRYLDEHLNEGVKG